MRSSIAALCVVGSVILAACAAPTGSGGPAQTSPGSVASPPSALPAASRTPSAAPSSAATASPPASPLAPSAITLQEFPVVRGSAPHDVAPAADGGVWYTGQGNGTLGHLDPRTGAVREVRLGAGPRRTASSSTAAASRG